MRLLQTLSKQVHLWCFTCLTLLLISCNNQQKTQPKQSQNITTVSAINNLVSEISKTEHKLKTIADSLAKKTQENPETHTVLFSKLMSFKNQSDSFVSQLNNIRLVLKNNPALSPKLDFQTKKDLQQAFRNYGNQIIGFGTELSSPEATHFILKSGYYNLYGADIADLFSVLNSNQMVYLLWNLENQVRNTEMEYYLLLLNQHHD